MEEKTMHSDEEQVDPHEEQQRLLRKRLRKIRQRKRRVRWKKQKNVLVRLAQEHYVGAITEAVSMPQLRPFPAAEDDSGKTLKAMWESFDGGEMPRAPIQSGSPGAWVRQQARQEQRGAGGGLQTSPVRVPGRPKRGKRNHYALPLKRRPKHHKQLVDEEEAILLKRQRLKETYAAFKAMTHAVVQAHGLLALKAAKKAKATKRKKKKQKGAKNQRAQQRRLQSMYGRNRNPGNLQPMNPELLADLEKQQQRLQLEMKTLTRQVNELLKRKQETEANEEGLLHGDIFGKLTLFK
jgi:hypothetical protein